MIATLGQVGLGAALLAGGWSVFAAAAAGRRTGADQLARVRAGLLASLAALLVAGVALAIAMARCDLRLAYVASHTELALSVPYRLAAFWSGQEGSLLLWAILSAAFAVAVAIDRRHMVSRGEPVTLGVLAFINVFFAAILLLAANPFVLLAEPARDGHGLNPQLQHWAMIAHPPALFVGYAGFAAPFAIMCGALAAGRSDNAWVRQMRPWALFAWLFQGIGISLGAWWAYVELGWGGYWAWDPVENASLLPWLTGTALIHTIIVHQHRGMLKEWTAGLAAATYMLCIFGTYITRSGVLQSVHAFAESLVGWFFLGLLVVLFVGSGALIVRRRGLLASESSLPGLLGRESLTLLGSVLLVTMAAATLLGTVFPLVSEAMGWQSISVGQAFYNRLVAPTGLAVAALMALSPLLVYGRAAAGVLRRGIVAPAAVALLAVAAAVVSGMRNPIALVCVGISVLAVSAMLITFVQAVWTQVRHGGFPVLEAAARIIDGNHRRYGGQVAHLGAVLVVIGVAGSSLFSTTVTTTIQPGETIAVGRQALRLEGLREVRFANYSAVVATITLTAPDGEMRRLMPQRRFYDKAEESTAEVAIRSSWREDLYVALVGWEAKGAAAAIQARINPLTLWIWIGSATIAAGAVLCLSPRLLPRPRDPEILQPSPRLSAVSESGPLPARLRGGS